MEDGTAVRMFLRRVMLLAVIAVAAIAIAAPAQAAALAVSQDALSLSAPPGQTAVDTVEVTNDSSVPVLVSMDTEPPESPFAADGCGAAIPAGGTCTVTVSYTPATRGPHEAILSVSSNGADVASDKEDISLTGTVGPMAQIAPDLLSFSAPVGATSTPQRVTLTNVGDVALAGTAPTVIGPNFAIVGSTCGGDLARDASCTVDVTFTAPAATGTSEAVLRFSTNASVDPVQDVALGATATPAGPPAPTPFLPPPFGISDRDGDGVPDNVEQCPRVAGDLKNGCPSELNADVVGRWRVNRLFSQLVALTVRSPTGARIELRCGGRPAFCPFRLRIIRQTTRRTTGLTRFFGRTRILRARMIITVRVMRPRQIGVYERLETRTGRRLPKVTQRCLGANRPTVRNCPA
ncbi:MAG TPA: choice-of-anchor D domain-containing protein [Solirubrobacteraceae bacterium]|nr:choice-of-anchor D domain-containing protein [Solirubrobacteraceae bacterium]